MYFKDKYLDLNRPHVMGILNVTPDSFSDGGQYISPDKAVSQARNLVAEGASIIDVGGESTRPGATEVNEQQELDRVIPVIEKISVELDTIISIDTSKASVMSHAVSAGAHMINDVTALQMEHALSTAASLSVPVCVMHMQGAPRSMQHSPQYQDVVKEITEFLMARCTACIEAGIAADQIIIDPGFGFGKTVQHNIELMQKLGSFVSGKYPVMLGISRKSTIGVILDRPIEERLAGSLALTALAVNAGVTIIRAHDVKATMDTINITFAIKNNA